VGKYQFNQLGNCKEFFRKPYTNFKPDAVSKGQFLKFNLTVYSKIIEIFYPEIAIGTTVVKGNINSDIKKNLN
jgi:hypothetical protein